MGTPARSEPSTYPQGMDSTTQGHVVRVRADHSGTTGSQSLRPRNINDRQSQGALKTQLNILSSTAKM